MTEDAAFDRLQAYLTKLAADAVLIDPARELLAEVNRAHQSVPRPKGAYATIDLLADRDLLEVDCEVYEDRTLGGQPRAILKKARGVEWLFRVEIFARRPVDHARLFATAFASPHAHVELAPLVVRGFEKTDRVPTLVQQEWEGRARLDVRLGGIVVENMLVDVIETGAIQFVGRGGAQVLRELTYTKD